MESKLKYWNYYGSICTYQNIQGSICKYPFFSSLVSASITLLKPFTLLPLPYHSGSFFIPNWFGSHFHLSSRFDLAVDIVDVGFDLFPFFLHPYEEWLKVVAWHLLMNNTQFWGMRYALISCDLVKIWCVFCSQLFVVLFQLGSRVEFLKSNFFLLGSPVMNSIQSKSSILKQHCGW